MAPEKHKPKDWPSFGILIIKLLNQGYAPDAGQEAEYQPDFELNEAEAAKLWGNEIEFDPDAVGIAPDPAAHRECESWLERFAEAWLKAGHDVRQWEFRRHMERELSRRTALLVSGQPPTVFLQASASEDPRENGHDVAVWLFFKLITSELFDRLERCTRCGDYYLVKRRQSGRKYCTAQCGRGETAGRRMRKLREMEYKLKLRECRRALDEIHQLPVQKRIKRLTPNWKGAVAGQAGPGITQHFVTRAFREGKLKMPAWLSVILEKG